MDRSIHVVVVQFKPRKGDYASNLARLAGIFSQIDSLDPRPDVAVFAETALTGYFVEGGVRDVALTAGAFARDLLAQYASAVTTPRTLDVCIGFYEVWNNAFYNSALYVTLGPDGPVIRHVHRRLFLPTYGLFDEERFVDRGFEVRARAPVWDETMMTISLDPQDITRARSDVPLLTELQTMMPLMMRTVDRIQAGERFVLSYDDAPTDGGPLTPVGSEADGERADAPSTEETARRPSDEARRSKEASRATRTQAAKRSTAKATANASRNGSEPLPVLRAADSRAGPPPLEIDPELTSGWLGSFLREEFERRGFEKAVIGL